MGADLFQAVPPPRTACTSCNADIVWCETPSKKRMPLDAKPQKLVVIIDGVGHVKDCYTSHFATCPAAASHRRPSQ